MEMVFPSRGYKNVAITSVSPAWLCPAAPHHGIRPCRKQSFSKMIYNIQVK